MLFLLDNIRTGAGSVPLTNGSRAGKPKNIWICIRIIKIMISSLVMSLCACVGGMFFPVARKEQYLNAFMLSGYGSATLILTFSFSGRCIFSLRFSTVVSCVSTFQTLHATPDVFQISLRLGCSWIDPGTSWGC